MPQYSQDRARPNDILLEPLQARVDRKDLSQPAVSHEHWRLIKGFYQKVQSWRREIYERCNEARFDMQLDDTGIYRRCVTDDDDIGLYTDLNNMDPFPVPSWLPPLSDAAESLIARVHVVMTIGRFKGHQYQYRGHICQLA